MSVDATAERMQFQAEVGRLLEIVAKSLYSQKEVFLRELVSNASDACDRLRYAAITEPDLYAGDAELRVVVTPDKDARTLTVSDNGVGMDRDDLVGNLGTIARSGTRAFLDAAEAKGGAADLTLIGQFGVGFYSAFMVAKEVEVFTRKAGDAEGWHWTSDGRGEFTVEPRSGLGRGTRIVLHLSDGENEFLEPDRLRRVIRTHCDHIAVPVVLKAPSAAEETVNRASALWTRPKTEIQSSDYTEFYRHVAHAFDEPYATIHWKAEGAIEYTGLVFVPAAAPFDLHDPTRRPRVKLYVRRVFVSDEAEGLVPAYLRFLRGVIDSEDLPLNVSREMLQGSPLVAKIRHALTRRVLQELARKADEDRDAYQRFWDAFGAVVKEGLYEDRDARDLILPLIRVRTTESSTPISLDELVARMKPGQEALYFISGDDPDALARSAHVEGFRAKGVDVAILTDPIDEFWVPAVGSYRDKPFRSVTRAGADLKGIDGEEAKSDRPAADGAVAALKRALGDAVKDVRTTERLVDSPACLVAADGDLDLHIERLLKQHRQINEASRRILEINPSHPLIRRVEALAGAGEDAAIEDVAFLLLDQSRILEGETLPDPAGFARRMTAAMLHRVGATISEAEQ